MKKTQVSIDTLNRTLPMVSPTNFPKILEENVGNFCPVCGKTIFSNLLEIDGKAYIEKNCCTKELYHLENDCDFFIKYLNNAEIKPLRSNPNPKNYQEWAFNNPNFGAVTAGICVTTKCNMNCPICSLKFNDCFNRNVEMPIREIKKRLRKYHSKDIIITGGEPTIREDLFEIIRIVKESGNVPRLITNGLKLNDRNYVKRLKDAGLKLIALQFDGFNKELNKRLRGQDYTEIKLKVLKNIEEVGGFCVSLVAVIERGRNDDEMSKIIDFGLRNEFIKRVHFIGLAPPKNESKVPTMVSDLIKIMEKEGYFDQEYFLELVKMYRNIFEETREIFEGTPLEGWAFRRLPGNFKAVHFKKEEKSIRLLFEKSEIIKINEIFSKIRNKKSRITSLVNLLRNSKQLTRSPLTTLFKEKVISGQKGPSRLLEVMFHQLCLDELSSRLLKMAKGALAEGLMIAPGIIAFSRPN